MSKYAIIPELGISQLAKEELDKMNHSELEEHRSTLLRLSTHKPSDEMEHALIRYIIKRLKETRPVASGGRRAHRARRARRTRRNKKSKTSTRRR
jgi:hypothetical protein